MTSDSDPPTRPARSNQPVELPPHDRPLAAIGLLAVLGVFNFLFLPMMRGAQGAEGAWLLVAIGAGIFAAELGLATLWLVWGPGPFGVRLLIHWAAGVGLYCCWATGLIAALSEGFLASEIPGMLGVTLCGLPIVSLAAQVPLWPLRTHLGWRIDAPSTRVPAAAPSQSLSIRDMVLATVVTAVSLASLRLVSVSMGGREDPQFWPIWGIALAIITGVSALTLLPATLIVFRILDKCAATVAWGGYAIGAWVATCVIVSVIAATMGGGGAAPAEVYIAILACYGSFAATLGLPLLVLASRGYRLTFASERRRADV